MNKMSLVAAKAAAVAATNPQKVCVGKAQFIIRHKDTEKLEVMIRTLKKSNKVDFKIECVDEGFFRSAYVSKVSGPAHLVSYYLNGVSAIAKG